MLIKWLKSLGNRGEVVVTSPASAGTTVTLPPGGDGRPPVTPPAFSIPDTYKDAPWVKGIDSVEKLWEMNAGAQKLIGQRPAGIPAPEAPQAEWDKFYEAAGRPKTAAEYAFDYGKDDKGVAKTAPDVKWEASVKEMLFKHGINSKQAAGLQKDFDVLVANAVKEKGIVLEQENADFTKTATDLFGIERDNVLANGKTLLTEHVKDPRIAGALAKLDNNSLMVLASALKSISDKFIKPAGAPATPPGTEGTGGGAQSADALRSEARRLMTLPEYTNSMHPDNPRILKQIQDLYTKASQIK